MRNPFLFLFLALLSLAALPRPGFVQIAAAEDIRNCTTTREFVTSLEYLRSQKEFKVPEEQARKISARVAQGCTGAARRFIQVTRALSVAGLATHDAMEEALKFSARPDVESDTFVTVFRLSFLPEGLDLDLRSALLLARTLSSEFQGDIPAVRDDFETLLNFCASNKKLDLPKPECGAWAAKIARLGQEWSGGVSRPFIRLFSFLTTKNGPNLTTAQALLLAKELVAGGPDSAENFISGYRYAISRGGLNMPVRDALGFARTLVFTPKALEKATEAPKDKNSET